MGTAVLSPQDCFNFHFNSYDQPLAMAFGSPTSLPRSKKKTIQSTAMYPMHSEGDRQYWSSVNFAVSSGPADLTSTQASGLLLSPERDTISAHVSETSKISGRGLPTPHMLSGVSSASDVNSRFSPFFLHPLRDRLSSATHPRFDLCDHRCLSAGPMSRFSGSDSSSFYMEERPYASAGRCPLRLAKVDATRSQFVCATTNCTSNTVPDKAQHSKFLDFKSNRKGAFFDDKKLGMRGKVNGSDLVGDIRKRSQGDFLSTKGKTEGEHANLKPSKQEADVKREGRRQWLEQSSTKKSASGTGSKPKIESGLSAVVTILQRPRTEEAARELLARFEWKGPESVSPSTEPDTKSKPCSSLSVFMQTTVPAEQCITSSSSALKRSLTPENEVQNSKRTEFRYEVGERAETENTACRLEVGVPEDGTGGIFPSTSLMYDERWAGPAFTISPPPSSLPLPKFSLRQLRSCSLELQLEKTEMLEQAGSAPITPAEQENGTHSSRFLSQEGRFDVAFATRDLRRILNLDSC